MLKFYPLLKNIDIISVRTGEAVHVYIPHGRPTQVGNIRCWRFTRTDGLHEVLAADVSELKRRLRWRYGRSAKIKIYYNR